MQMADFHASQVFRGPADGFVFKKGSMGVGYYRDTQVQPHAMSQRGRNVPTWPRARTLDAQAPPSGAPALRSGAVPPGLESQPAAAREEFDPDAQFMVQLRAYAEKRNLDVPRLLREAGNPREGARGIITKVKFMSAMLSAFHGISGEMLQGGLERLANIYGCGPVDARDNGFLDVAWQAFAQDLMAGTH